MKLSRLLNKIKGMNALTIDEKEQIYFIKMCKSTLDNLIANDIYVLTGLFILMHPTTPYNTYYLGKQIPLDINDLIRPMEFKKIKSFKQLINFLEYLKKENITIITSKKTLSKITSKKLTSINFKVEEREGIPEGLIYVLNNYYPYSNRYTGIFGSGSKITGSIDYSDGTNNQQIDEASVNNGSK